MAQTRQKGKQGFASMDPKRQREISSWGGKASAEKRRKNKKLKAQSVQNQTK